MGVFSIADSANSYSLFFQRCDRKDGTDALRLKTFVRTPNQAFLFARKEKDKKEETAQKARYEAMIAQRGKELIEEDAQKTRYEELQSTRGLSATSTASPVASIQTKKQSATSSSLQNSAKTPLTNISSSSITTSLPLPTLNQSFSAECKSCTFQLDYKLNDVSNWICGIPITCQMCDNLVAFSCDDEKCKKLNYVTMVCSLGQMQSLRCFACKKLYGSTQEEVIRKSEKVYVAITHATSSSASATVANASSSSSSSLPAPPTVSTKSPVRLIFTMPSSKKKEEVVKTTISPRPSIMTHKLTSTTSSMTVIPISPQLPLVVSESTAGRLIAMKGTHVLEKSNVQSV
jgi:hypothetical protein